MALPTKALALLAYIAVESGRAHRREDLATLLWPDSPEGKGRHNLRQALTILRQRLRLDRAGAPFLRMTRDTVAFDRRSNHRIDLHEMLMPLQCPPQGDGSRGSCRSGCFTRAALHRGPFLEDLSIAESETFAHWVVVQREMVDRKAAQMLERLYGCYAEEDRQGALPVLRRQLELDPWNENVHRELMRVLSLSGQTNAAIRHFDAFARRIRAELGVEPEEETVALYEAIRAKRGRWPRAPQIVVVDGDAAARARTADFLRGNGFEVHEAAGAADCRAIVESGAADAVVTEVTLPDGGGIPLATELRRTSDIGIIFLSARGAPRDRIAALDAGADDYVTKPPHLPELAARLRSVLRRRG